MESRHAPSIQGPWSCTEMLVVTLRPVGAVAGKRLSDCGTVGTGWLCSPVTYNADVPCFSVSNRPVPTQGICHRCYPAGFSETKVWSVQNMRMRAIPLGSRGSVNTAYPPTVNYTAELTSR